MAFVKRYPINLFGRVVGVSAFASSPRRFTSFSAAGLEPVMSLRLIKVKKSLDLQ
jgi:hypothetical protein